jgi:hypothetical protein
MSLTDYGRIALFVAMRGAGSREKRLLLSDGKDNGPRFGDGWGRTPGRR